MTVTAPYRGPGGGDEPLPDLLLDHDQHALDRRDVVEDRDDERGGDVVREVGHEDPGLAVAEFVGEVELGDVGVDHAHVVEAGDLLAQYRDQAVVDLDGEHLGAGLREGEGEGTQTGPDLDDLVVATDVGHPGDPPDGVRVDHEVLPERTSRREAVLLQEFRSRRA